MSIVCIFFYSSAALSTLKRKISDGSSTPSKKYSLQYSKCFVFPSTKSQETFIRRGKKEPRDVEILDAILHDEARVLAIVATRSSLPMISTMLKRYLCYSADIIIVNKALMTGALKIYPGTCHCLDFTDRKLKLCFPYFQISAASSLTSRKFRVLTSPLAKDEKPIGLVRFEVDPHDLEQYMPDGMKVHHMAVTIGTIGPEMIHSNNDILDSFDHKNATFYLVNGAYDVLKCLRESKGNIRKAMHLASKIGLPDGILSPRDDGVLQNPRSREHNHKLISAFSQLIEPLITIEETEALALLLFDGDMDKYDKCLLAALDEPDTVLSQVFLKFKSTDGDCDLFKLKELLDQMENTKFAEMFDNYLFSFRAHHLDCAC